MKNTITKGSVEKILQTVKHQAPIYQ